ncbi:MAG: mechanosensitive ion channel family protein [Pseudomonadales bacterium]
MEETVKQELASVEKFYDLALNFFVEYGFQVVGAIIILLLGFWIASRVGKAVVALCERRNVDVTLSKFTGSTARILILVCFVIISLGKFGVSVAPFLAVLGVVGLGAGLAVQGLLSNYSAGIAIILTRPFKVGNTITVSDVYGEVMDIRLASTILLTEDGEEITLPNKHVIGEILKNSFDYRLVESAVGIAYSESPQQAIEVISGAIDQLDCVTKEPAYMVGIESFADSAIVISVRCWVPTRELYQSRYRINAAIYQALQQANITIPFPQQDVYIKT